MPKTTEIQPYNAPDYIWLEENVLARKRIAAHQATKEQIGQRLAQLRKERGITQKEMADLLEISQPIVSDYERGELRLHGELIVKLARILRTTADEILGIEETKPTRSTNDRRLLRRVTDIDRLTKRDRDALVRTIDAFLAKASGE